MSRIVTEVVADRFGAVEVRRYPSSTLLSVQVPDQPVLRSLLVTLFDVGHEVLSITQEDLEAELDTSGGEAV
jgi:hypothetical protein